MTTNEYIHDFFSDNISLFSGVNLLPYIESEDAAYKGGKINMTVAVGDEKWEYNIDESQEGIIHRVIVSVEIMMFAQITKGSAAGGELRQKVGVMTDTLMSYLRVLGSANPAVNVSAVTGGSSVRAKIAGVTFDEIYKAPDRLRDRAAIAATGRVEVIITEN